MSPQLCSKGANPTEDSQTRFPCVQNLTEILVMANVPSEGSFKKLQIWPLLGPKPDAESLPSLTVEGKPTPASIQRKFSLPLFMVYFPSLSQKPSETPILLR